MPQIGDHDVFSCSYRRCWRRARRVGCAGRCGPHDRVGQVSRYRNNHRRSAGSGSRWMSLRYLGECKVCGSQIAAGDSAYWDASARTVTCHAIECCDADGLTTSEPLTGPWDQRTDTRVRADHRIGEAAPVPARVIVTRFNSGGVVTQNSRGRCIDAPCCGCCS
jgi:hypothetical protein